MFKFETSLILKRRKVQTSNDKKKNKKINKRKPARDYQIENHAKSSLSRWVPLFPSLFRHPSEA